MAALLYLLVGLLARCTISQKKGPLATKVGLFYRTRACWPPQRFFFCWFAERMLCFFGYGIFPELGLPRLDVVNQPGHARSGWIAG